MQRAVFLQYSKLPCGLVASISQDAFYFYLFKETLNRFPHNVREYKAPCDMNTVTHISSEVLLDPTGEF